MLPKAFRLPKEYIPFIIKKGYRIYSPVFSIIFLPGATDSTRLAIIVRSKARSKAVERNRIKRLLRHAVMGYINSLPVPVDAVVFVQPAYQASTTQETKKLLSPLFEQIREKGRKKREIK